MREAELKRPGDYCISASPPLPASRIIEVGNIVSNYVIEIRAIGVMPDA